MQMVEVRPLKPFVGSYRCSLAEADMIDEHLKEDANGIVIKEKVPRKRIVGMISVQRALLPSEHKAWIDGKLNTDIYEVSEDGRMCIEHPPQRTLIVPIHVASSLISRGLAAEVAPIEAASTEVAPKEAKTAAGKKAA